MKLELEVPNPPEGWEIYRYGSPNPGERYHDALGWHDYRPMSESCHLIARKKRTLADWANEQPLFQALAKMRSGIDPTIETVLIHGFSDAWLMQNTVGNCSKMRLAEPPSGMGSHRLQLVNGKWELA